MLWQIDLYPFAVSIITIHTKKEKLHTAQISAHAICKVPKSIILVLLSSRINCSA